MSSDQGRLGRTLAFTDTCLLGVYPNDFHDRVKWRAIGQHRANPAASRAPALQIDGGER